MHAALDQVVGELPEADGDNPLDDAVVAPHEHVCTKTEGSGENMVRI